MQQKLLALAQKPIDMIQALLDGVENKFVRNPVKLVFLIVLIAILLEIAGAKENGLLDQILAKCQQVVDMVGGLMSKNGVWIIILAVLFFTFRKPKPTA